MTSNRKQYLLLFKQWWTVTISNPCGPVNVFFASNYADGTPEFIGDLSYAVNYSYNHCGYSGPSYELN